MEFAILATFSLLHLLCDSTYQLTISGHLDFGTCRCFHFSRRPVPWPSSRTASSRTRRPRRRVLPRPSSPWLSTLRRECCVSYRRSVVVTWSYNLTPTKGKTFSTLGWRGTGVERAPAGVYRSGKEAGETDRQNGRCCRSSQNLISLGCLHLLGGWK